jgi:membrane-bound ClpP family serine protease
VGLIKIDDRTNGITQGTWLYVKGALDRYKEMKPDFIILELNTPGGEVFTAQKISDALKEMDTQYKIPCVAYINNWAISAGAMLAYSCRYIVVVTDASMGAAEPVIASETGEMKEASEKVRSAIRADFANRARFFGRNPSIAEGMVDKDLILVLRNGEIRKVDNENQIQTSDMLVKPKGKLLTLDAEQLIQFGVADLKVEPKQLALITRQEEEKGEWPAEKMLLFSAPFFNSIPNAVVDEFKPDWKTRFFMILANPIVSSALFLGMMVGFYIELNTPGVTLPGTIGALCLFLIILSSFAQEIGNVLELIFLVVGMMIILAEIFILPTFGLLGVIGILFFLVGLFGLMLPGIGSIGFDFDTQTLNAAGEAFMHQLVWLCGTIVAGTIIIALLARYVLPAFSPFKRFVLTGHEQEGYAAVETARELPPVGAKGEVVATLRPAGKVDIQETIFDAVSTGSFIEKGTKVKVVGHDSGNIIVASDEGEEP